MKRKQHKNILSNTSLKALKDGKYNKVTRSKPLPDITRLYEIRLDGWRRKKIIQKGKGNE